MKDFTIVGYVEEASVYCADCRRGTSPADLHEGLSVIFAGTEGEYWCEECGCNLPTCLPPDTYQRWRERGASLVALESDSQLWGEWKDIDDVRDTGGVLRVMVIDEAEETHLNNYDDSDGVWRAFEEGAWEAIQRRLAPLRAQVEQADVPPSPTLLALREWWKGAGTEMRQSPNLYSAAEMLPDLYQALERTAWQNGKTIAHWPPVALGVRQQCVFLRWAADRDAYLLMEVRTDGTGEIDVFGAKVETGPESGIPQYVVVVDQTCSGYASMQKPLASMRGEYFDQLLDIMLELILVGGTLWEAGNKLFGDGE